VLATRPERKAENLPSRVGWGLGPPPGSLQPSTSRRHLRGSTRSTRVSAAAGRTAFSPCRDLIVDNSGILGGGGWAVDLTILGNCAVEKSSSLLQAAAPTPHHPRLTPPTAWSLHQQAAHSAAPSSPAPPSAHIQRRRTASASQEIKSAAEPALRTPSTDPGLAPLTPIHILPSGDAHQQPCLLRQRGSTTRKQK
jgi:hypothetical protein